MKSNHGLEATLEFSGATLAILTDSEILKDIPVMSTLIGVFKAAQGISEQIFMSKLAAFLLRLDSIPIEDRQRKVREILENEKQREKVGETMIYMIHSATDRDKPELIALFFAAYVEGYMTVSGLFRCWDAIHNAFPGDLRQFLGLETLPADDQPDEYLVNLGRTGLTLPYDDTLIGGDPGVIPHKVSELGTTFREVYEKMASRIPPSEPLS